MLVGGAGDDRLVAGAGVDELRGGAGADSLDVTGKAIVTDTIDGGEGVDTLTVSNGQDLSGATLSGVEVIVGAGTIRLTVEQLSQLTELRGVNVRLIGDDTNFETPATLSLTNGAWVALTNGTILGTDGDDVLAAGAGDQAFALGVGDDTIDGGAGYNTVQVSGSADAFFWTVNSNGEVVLTDLVNDSGDLVDGSDEGTDTLTNIQAIRYVNPVTGEATVFELDDHGNSPDAGNKQIQFGEVVSGRANFYGDNDYFTIQMPDSGDYHLASYGDREFSLYIGNENYYASRQGQTYSFTGDSELRSIAVNSNELYLDANNPRASQGYSFAIRRILNGTNANDTLTAGANFEYLDGALGDDVLIGSDRSDILNGGEGNDVLTGGLGNDWLEGGNGGANVAVFSGTRAEYNLEWSSGYRNL